MMKSQLYACKSATGSESYREEARLYASESVIRHAVALLYQKG